VCVSRHAHVIIDTGNKWLSDVCVYSYALAISDAITNIKVTFKCVRVCTHKSDFLNACVSTDMHI